MEIDLRLNEKIDRILSFLNEKQRRLYLAAEARYLGRGGIAQVMRCSGISKPTLLKGIKELNDQAVTDNISDRQRAKGGGRHSLIKKYPDLLQDLDALISPSTRGDPMSPMRWCSKSLRKLEHCLKARGYRISYRVIGDILTCLGYSLQSNKKVNEGKQHPDRDAQFNYINETVKSMINQGQPVISVDCKKKELIGNYKNNGKEWQPSGVPEEVNVYDFEDKHLGKAVPYGIYDIERNEGWVNVGISSDTAQFAVNSIRTWWDKMGKGHYPQGASLLIVADGGGSNGRRNRLWKSELQKFAKETELKIRVCHLPPGTSKWNKIEHRLFSFITINWRGKPLRTLQTVVNLIASTTTKEGLAVKAAVDENQYLTGIKISDQELNNLNIIPDTFHGEWNYSIE